MHLAAICGNERLANLLIKQNCQIDVKDKHDHTPLYYSIINNRFNVFALLIPYYQNVINNGLFKNNDTPLHLAAQCGHGDILHRLIQSKANPCVLNKNSCSVLDIACENNNLSIVKQLLEQFDTKLFDYNPELPTNCLQIASKNENLDIIRLLLIHNYDVNSYTNQLGTALHEACRYGRTQSCKLLLEAGINTNQVNSLNQKAIDVIIRLPKIENDIKKMIKEYSEVLSVVSIESHESQLQGSLSFNKNEIIKVLDNNLNGFWRGFIVNKSNFTAKYGYFPSHYVRLIDENETQHKKTLIKFLNECDLECHFDILVENGFDMVSLKDITYFDLCTIGMYDPIHRKILLEKIKTLDILNLNNKTESLLISCKNIKSLFEILNLDEYLNMILSKYEKLEEFLFSINNAGDLEKVGITKLGHQKKLLNSLQFLKKQYAINSKVTDNLKFNKNIKSLEDLHLSSNRFSFTGYNQKSFSTTIDRKHSCKIIRPKDGNLSSQHNLKNDKFINDIDFMLNDLNRQLDAMLENKIGFKV